MQNKIKIKLTLSFLIICALHSNGYNQYSKNFDRFSQSPCINNFNNRLNANNEHPKTGCQLLPNSEQKSISATTQKKKIHKDRLILSGIGLIGLNIAAYQPFKQTWWEEERTGFH
ncbi:hypothetical protein H8E88_05485, partial [candidate division KSB1 bacterium]|nr:hypothetical protein [candidate division KSB1 bacterium]